jgi:hypothetical protein
VPQQRHNKQNDKNVKKNFGHARRGERDSRKAKNCRNQCDNEEDQSPSELGILVGASIPTRAVKFNCANCGARRLPKPYSGALIFPAVKRVVGKNKKTQ